MSTSPHTPLPVAPSLEPTLARASTPKPKRVVSPRTLIVCLLSAAVAVVASLCAQLLTALIALITNIAFFGQLSLHSTSPAGNTLGLGVVIVPVIGGLIVGAMARYGSAAIRGHGIPEAMERILAHKSRIPARLTWLKPLSSAVAIGTGGPFGAEGPIIATGGALGSLLGQLVPTSADERKTLLAAGAAAGMAATFGSPVSAVLLAIELLLFEYRPRSVVPVALATVVATGIRASYVGFEPAFAMPAVASPSGGALAAYVLVGAIVGFASSLVTRAVYAIEDAFEKLPIPWPMWPAIGGLAVGLVGYVAPRTLGVGYANIEAVLQGKWALGAIAVLCGMKFLSWSIALGSGTSGGTLAPLFTVGSCLGALLGTACVTLAPSLGVDPRVAALVGMAAMFAGASRALLTSVVFAFETTRQPMGLLPLLGGCTAAYLVSALWMRESIMTAKLVRRGTRVPEEYAADPLEQLVTSEVATREPVTLRAAQDAGEVRAWLDSGAPGSGHQGYPVVDEEGRLCGVITRRDVWAAREQSVQIGALVTRPAVIAHLTDTLRDAADRMVAANVGRLPIVASDDPTRVIGMLTRSDLLGAHAKRLSEGARSSRQPFARAKPANAPPMPDRPQSV